MAFSTVTVCSTGQKKIQANNDNNPPNAKETTEKPHIEWNEFGRSILTFGVTLSLGCAENVVNIKIWVSWKLSQITQKPNLFYTPFYTNGTVSKLQLSQ